MRTYWNSTRGTWSRGSLPSLGWVSYNYIVAPLVVYMQYRKDADKVASQHMIKGMSQS